MDFDVRLTKKKKKIIFKKMEEEKKIISSETPKEKGKDFEEEKINFLPLFTFFLFLIVIFQFFYIVSLKRKISETKVLGGSSVNIIEDFNQTRNYLKKLYETYKCDTFYDPSTSTAFQIYNLFYCIKEKAEKQ